MKQTKILWLLVAASWLCAGCDNKDKLDRRGAEKLLVGFFGFPSVEYDTNGEKRYFGRYSLVDEVCMGQYARNCLNPETDEIYFGIQELKGITGITDTHVEGIKEVRYTVVRKQVTAAGRCMGYRDNEEVDLRVFCRKFDDGWRIDLDKHLPVIKPGKYPHLFNYSE